MRRATAAITAPITIKAMRMLIVFTLLATAAAAGMLTAKVKLNLFLFHFVLFLFENIIT